MVWLVMVLTKKSHRDIIYYMQEYAYSQEIYSLCGLVKVFKALSDETRIRILRILLKRECCVCEVMQALDISESRASRNLKILYEAGLLNLKKDGLWTLYSLDQKKMEPYLGEIVRMVEKALRNNETALRDRQRLEGAGRVGPACVQRRRREKR